MKELREVTIPYLFSKDLNNQGFLPRLTYTIFILRRKSNSQTILFPINILIWLLLWEASIWLITVTFFHLYMFWFITYECFVIRVLLLWFSRLHRCHRLFLLTLEVIDSLDLLLAWTFLLLRTLRSSSSIKFSCTT